jgi:hypothetical protein
VKVPIDGAVVDQLVHRLGIAREEATSTVCRPAEGKTRIDEKKLGFLQHGVRVWEGDWRTVSLPCEAEGGALEDHGLWCGEEGELDPERRGHRVDALEALCVDVGAGCDELVDDAGVARGSRKVQRSVVVQLHPMAVEPSASLVGAGNLPDADIQPPGTILCEKGNRRDGGKLRAWMNCWPALVCSKKKTTGPSHFPRGG